MTPVNLHRRRSAPMLAAAGCLLTIVMVGAPMIHNGPGGWVVLASFLAAGAICFVAATWLADTVDQRVGVLIVLSFAIIVRIAYLAIDPQLSTDLYRYIWDGRVIASGTNPYRYVPAAPELAGLRDAAIYPWINRADYAVTIYPPVAEMFYFLVTRVGDNVTTMKAGMVGCEFATILCLLGIMRRRDIAPVRIAAYAWHPLPIWEIAGNGHVDALMIMLMTCALLSYFRGSVLLAGALATMGALVKPTSLLVLPVLWRPWNWRLVGIVVLTVAVAYAPFLSVGGRVVGFVPEYIGEEGLASGSGFRIVQLVQAIAGRALPGLSSVYLTVGALVMAAMAMAAGFRSDRSEGAAIFTLGWMLIAFLMLSSPHYPWYFLVLVPFLVLAPTASGWAFTIAPALLYAGEWSGHATRELVLTLIMLSALAIDLWRATAASRLATIGDVP